jgi:hypothetical protein
MERAPSQEETGCWCFPAFERYAQAAKRTLARGEIKSKRFRLGLRVAVLPIACARFPLVSLRRTQLIGWKPSPRPRSNGILEDNSRNKLIYGVGPVGAVQSWLDKLSGHPCCVSCGGWTLSTRFRAFSARHASTDAHNRDDAMTWRKP